MPRNKNNQQQNKNHYNPCYQHKHQNMKKKDQSCTAGRNAAHIQKQQSEQHECLAKLLEKQHKEAQKNTEALLGPIGSCMVPQFVAALERNQSAPHQANVSKELAPTSRSANRPVF